MRGCNMKRIAVKCSNRKPRRVFDLVLDDKDHLFVEIKFPGSGIKTKVRIDEYISKIYCKNYKESNRK
jgi:hypothetical protein